MWATIRPLVVFSAIVGGKFVHAALNDNGTQAIDPVSDEDASPIADINTYYPDQHDCPLPCTDYSNIHSWITYFSIERLRRCSQPMLLQIPISQSLNDPQTTTLIRSCTLGSVPVRPTRKEVLVDNPKKEIPLAAARLATEPACISSGVPTGEKVQLFSSENSKVDRNNDKYVSILRGIQKFFGAEDNCDESFIFAHYNDTLAGVYIGSQVGKGTVQSSVQALINRYPEDSLPSHAIAEFCHANGTKPEHVFGIIVESARGLASVQDTVREWSQGNCVDRKKLTSAGPLSGATVLEVSSLNDTFPGNYTVSHNRRSLHGTTHWSGLYSSDRKGNAHLGRRATCSYLTVSDGDTCPSLVKKCGISSPNFVRYNPKTNLCSTLKIGDFVCCSAGDLPSAGISSPKPGADGVCATHLIQNGDTCSALATKYGVTVDEIEKWNKGKTWAWTTCKDMLLGYNLCVSDGFAPMPPPQQGTECGPLVPNTPALTDRTKSLADLNPCPLKACCSNWGFCGVFPGHCGIHAPEGGGPGAKEKGFQNTCVSNCGNEIKSNSDAPAKFERIGYYESWNMNRDCLWLKAENANTGNYTHIHWGFAEIDPQTFKVIIKDDHKQWDGFKNLKNVKRIVSFGGWAYSTENPGATIMRQAIINNRNIFAANLAQFAKDEGIDGIDIDWEYPGAPDIVADGAVLGQKSDGLDYLKFLTVLKQQMGTKLVSIAAPASYWYLKAFPIDRIAKVIDYIVYMTYDLHGQWDYGNPNSFDQCDSGKCIRSHVNLTETTNALAMITKAGVPNNKIFVGESSYGRSFRMAKDGCWSAMCEFTGSRTKSDAAPGRCTNTSGYLAQAEIEELMMRQHVRGLYDPISNSDVLIYNGDYISFMDESTKSSRRIRWQNYNFAGTIDWAVDLQAFSDEDKSHIPDRPKSGMGCVSGSDDTVNTLELCEFACAYGFCPETLCTCTEQGDLQDLPRVVFDGEIESWLPTDVDINRLCKFSCKYGYCPQDVCVPPVIDEEVDEDDNPSNSDWDKLYTRDKMQKGKCMLWKGISENDHSAEECKAYCSDEIKEGQEAGRTTNYGCISRETNKDGSIAWNKMPGGWVVPGECLCDNWVLNELADTVLEAMPMIAQISCYILMSSLKFVLDVGAQFVPVVGKALDAGLDMAATAAQMAAYLYPEEEDPEGAFSWWLQPCGGTDLVPDDIKKVFGILSTVADGVTSFKEPKNLRRGSGKKGDNGNPHESDRSKPSAPTAPKKTKKKCNIKKKDVSKLGGAAKNVWMKAQCINDMTHSTQYIITSLSHAPKPQTLQIIGTCRNKWEQACFHYESAIGVNPGWATLTCPPAAATTSRSRLHGIATDVWKKQHDGDGWQDNAHRREANCDRDEFPPIYFMESPTDPVVTLGGTDPAGQLVRWIPRSDNRGAAAMWRGICFEPSIEGFTEQDFLDNMKKDLAKQDVTETYTTGKNKDVTKTLTQYYFSATVERVPEFTIGSYEPKPLGNDDGLSENRCWPKDVAGKDPGFVLLTIDPYYGGNKPPYDYAAKYEKGVNGD